MNQFVEVNHDAFVKDLQKLISFKSVFDPSQAEHPFGEENTKALEFMLELGRKQGFKTRNIDNKVGYIEYGEGEGYVAVLTHLDVVPEGNGWTFDPFKAICQEGKIYGRGVLDDKGPALMCFYALMALKEEGFQPKHRIRLIMGLNEESGSKCMNHYVSKEPQPVAGFTPDGAFPLIFAEKGIMSVVISKEFKPSIKDGGLHVVSITGGTAGNMVPDYCKAVLEGNHAIEHIIQSFNDTYSASIIIRREDNQIILESRGKGAHASMPEKGLNAISLMMKCLDCLDLEIGDVANYIRGYARRIGIETDGESMGLKCSDGESGSLTLNVGIVNLTEHKGSFDINIRYPVTLDQGVVLTSTYKEVLDFEGWNAKVKSHAKPLYMDQKSLLVQKLMAVYIEHTGEKDAKPIAIGGGTYARSMKNVVAFGIMLPHMNDLMHQADEYLDLEDAKKITNIMIDSMKTISL